MILKLIGAGRICRPIILFASIIALLHGCKAGDYSTEPPPIPTSIVEIRVEEEDQSWNCVVNANNPLTFSAVNSVSPPGVLLYFPATTLAIADAAATPPANEIIGAVEADEFFEGNLTHSRIFVGLSMDRPYRMSPLENGLKISFPKALAEPVAGEAAIISANADTAAAAERDFPSASRLKTVTATPLKDHLVVNVYADGAISDYQSFALDNPARIVFDIYKVKSPHQDARIIAVDSQWVKRIRYSPYPDKVRLVLDTQNQFLTQYFSFPTGSGLIIYIGRLPDPLPAKR
jgi:hypothetical protein